MRTKSHPARIFIYLFNIFSSTMFELIAELQIIKQIVFRFENHLQSYHIGVLNQYLVIFMLCNPTK